MNLFLVGLCLSESMTGKATQALRSISTVYPQLDKNTVKIVQHGQVFVGTVQTNPAVAFPREYVANSGTGMTLFTGTPISADRELVPHRASDLMRQWTQLPEKLDGQFAAVKVDLQSPSLEVLTDPLGMEQVYIYQDGPLVVVSNSVRLIEQTCGLTALDPIGASLMLSLGWVGGNRTLRESVQVLSGGCLHRWAAAGYRTSMTPRQPPGDVEALAHHFIALVRGLSDRFGSVVCDLTGGRDSRVLAAATIASGIPASYVTEGAPGSKDVQIATDIATALSLSHRIDNPKAEVLDRWDDGVRRLIQQNDGMVDLWQLSNVIAQPHTIDHLPVELWGSGGEIARGFYYHHLNLQPTLSARQMMQLFPSRLVKQDAELLTLQTRQLAINSVRETCRGFLDDGFAPRDVPDAFYAFDRVRRWAGANSRKVAPICDLLTPFCTKSFLEAARAMPVADRIAGRLHPELIRALTPALLDFPFDKPHTAQVSRRSLKQAVKDMVPRWLLKRLRSGARPLPNSHGPVQADWVEAKRETIREVCLSQPRSIVWNLVDRQAFETMLSSTTPAQVRRPYCQRILSIATVLYYEARASAPGTASAPPSAE